MSAWMLIADKRDALEEKRLGFERYLAAQIRDQIVDMAEEAGIELTPQRLEEEVQRTVKKPAMQEMCYRWVAEFFGPQSLN